MTETRKRRLGLAAGLLIGIIVGVQSFPTKNRDTTLESGLPNVRLATIIPISIAISLALILNGLF